MKDLLDWLFQLSQVHQNLFSLLYLFLSESCKMVQQSSTPISVMDRCMGQALSVEADDTFLATSTKENHDPNESVTSPYLANISRKDKDLYDVCRTVILGALQLEWTDAVKKKAIIPQGRN